MSGLYEVVAVLAGLELAGALLAILVLKWLGSLSSRKE
jgi:hypothetical protein